MVSPMNEDDFIEYAKKSGIHVADLSGYLIVFVEKES